jgi:hypothetical protein
VFLPVGNRVIARAIRNLRKGLGKVPPGKAMDELSAGEQVLLHDEATVLTRFPMPEEKETWRGRPARKVTTFMDLAQTEQRGITKPSLP